MSGLLTFLRRGYYDVKWCARQVPYIIKANDINCYLEVPAKEHRVNVFDYSPKKSGLEQYLFQNEPYNLGDSLGEVIIDFLLSKKNLDKNKWISSKKHLFTVGSNITGGKLRGNYQDATIWGSGILKEPSRREVIFQKLSRRKLDVRAVRGL